MTSTGMQKQLVMPPKPLHKMMEIMSLYETNTDRQQTRRLFHSVIQSLTVILSSVSHSQLNSHTQALTNTQQLQLHNQLINLSLSVDLSMYLFPLKKD